MSQTPDNANVKPFPTESPEAPVEKTNIFQRGRTFVKSHKKATIAVVALGGLVGVAALTGKKKVDSSDTLELTTGEDFDYAELEAMEQDATQAN